MLLFSLIYLQFVVIDSHKLLHRREKTISRPSGASIVTFDRRGGWVLKHTNIVNCKKKYSRDNLPERNPTSTTENKRTQMLRDEDCG